MIDRRLIRAKLDACALYLRRLEPLARLSFAQFSRDYTRFNAAERLVQLTVDAAVDVNNHLLIESHQPTPKDYYSSFTALVRIRVVRPAGARALARTTGLRNRLVHGYESVDLKILHGSLQGLIREYRAYIVAVRKHARC